MSKLMDTLVRAKEEIMLEMTRCGEAGGTGRIMSYVPQLVNLQKAMEIVKADEGVAFAEKMQAAKAAKKAE